MIIFGQRGSGSVAPPLTVGRALRRRPDYPGDLQTTIGDQWNVFGDRTTWSPDRYTPDHRNAIDFHIQVRACPTVTPCAALFGNESLFLRRFCLHTQKWWFRCVSSGCLIRGIHSNSGEHAFHHVLGDVTVK